MRGEVFRGEQPDGAIDLDVERRARVVGERHALSEAHGIGRLAVDIPFPPIDGVGHLPMIEIERIAFLEVQGELSAFGAEPETIFAAEDIDVRLPLARGDRCTADPSEARRIGATGRARHHAALILRRNHDLRRAGRIGQHHNLSVLPEKRQVGLKLARRGGSAAGAGVAATNRQERTAPHAASDGV